MTQKFYVDSSGNFLGSFDGVPGPTGSSEVPSSPPISATQKWNGTAWQNPPAPTTYMLSKATVWRRMTTAEAATMDGIMQETDAQIKQIYLAAQYLSTTDELWGMLKDMLTAAFSASRANELLAPE